MTLGTEKMSAKQKRPPSMLNTPESNTPAESCPKPWAVLGSIIYWPGAMYSIPLLYEVQWTLPHSTVAHRTWVYNSSLM